VDRSEGPRKGWVYAAWTDRNGTAADPDCAGVASASNANVYYSRSSDGGTTWSPPAVVHTNPANTDQFNQWMDVDPSDGAVYVASTTPETTRAARRPTSTTSSPGTVAAPGWTRHA